MARTLFIGVILILLQLCFAEDVHFFVGTNGSDANSGLTIQTAVKTIQHAITLASSASVHGKNIFIELLPGYHDLTTPLHIRHSGNSLTVRSYMGQEVHVTGGRGIPSSNLRPVTDQNILNALPASSRQFVRYVHLPDINITDYGAIHAYGSGGRRIAMMEVIYNGQPFRLARWPNEGFINVAGMPDGRHGRRITYNSTRPLSWKYLDDVWVYGYWYVAWSDNAFPVKSLDPSHMMITFDNKTRIRHGFKTGNLGTAHPHEAGYFRFINILSELDEPGEYYLDKKTGNLYVWLPTKDGSPKPDDDIHVSILNTCLVIDRSSHNINLFGFIVEACRERGIYANSVSNVQISNMEIRNTGDFGLYFDSNTKSCTVSKSVFRDNDGGIYLTGGNRELLQGAGNTVEDCKFYRYAREGAINKPAIAIYGVGNFVRYNEISLGQASAITFFGNDHVIEYNDIHHACMMVSYCAAIQASNDWTCRGNKIRYNTIHDVQKMYPGRTNSGILLDNGMSSADITNNVLYNNQVHITVGGGRDNIITNNIMYNASLYSIYVDGRLAHWNANQLGNMNHRLNQVPYNSSLWSARYPKLASIKSQNETLPEGNQIHKNIYYNTGHKQFVYGTGWLLTPPYYNTTDIGYSYGVGDHYDVNNGDLRVRCHAAQWANKVNFEQVVTPNDVGPRFDVGPAFNTIAHRSVHLTGSGNVCPSVAPSTNTPMPAYLPDGSGQSPLFKVFDEGCWLKVDKCTNDPEAIGTYRDMYGERTHNASTNETACLQRAIAQWHFCGSKRNEGVTAVFGPTGATTFGGDGCFMATYGCPRHGGPGDGHVVEGKVYRDVSGENRRNASIDQERCLARSTEIWHHCGSFPNHPVTAIFRPTGAIRTTGAGCWIKMEKCPKQPNLKTSFYDAHGATNAQSDDVEMICFTRAEYYWKECGSDSDYPVTAYYRPTTQSSTYP